MDTNVTSDTNDTNVTSGTNDRNDTTDTNDTKDTNVTSDINHRNGTPDKNDTNDADVTNDTNDTKVKSDKNDRNDTTAPAFSKEHPLSIKIVLFGHMMIIVKNKYKHQDKDKHLCCLQEYNLVLGNQVLGLGSQHFLPQTLHLKHMSL